MKILSFERLAYCIGLLLLTLIVYNFSPNPDDGITDDHRYYRQATAIEKYGVFDGFDYLAKKHVEEHKPDLKDSTPQGHHPLRIGQILVHRTFLLVDSTIFAGTYVSVFFYFLLGVLCYWFLSLYWKERKTLAIASLVLIGPLLMGFSARAIMETQHYFMMLLALFSAINYIHYPNKKNIVLFILALFLNLVWKETSALFFPFFIGIVFVSKWIYNKDIDYKHIAAFIFIPPIMVLVCYFILFGYDNLQKIVITHANIHLFNERGAYHVKSKNGPWYQYFVDFFMLSPVVSIFFFLGVGYFIANLKGRNIFESKNRQDINAVIFFAFLVYAFGVFALLIKHVRYAIFLEFVYRFFAVSFIFELGKQLFEGRKYFWPTIFACVLLVGATDLRQYHHFFVKSRMTDVWNVNLAKAEKFFQLNRKKNKNVKKDTSAVISSLHKKSLRAYNNDHYTQSVKLANEALEMQDNSFSYFMLCQSYYSLNKFELANENCLKYKNYNFDSLPDKNKKWVKQRLKKVNKFLELIED